MATDEIDDSALGPEWLSFWQAASGRARDNVAGGVDLRFLTIDYEELVRSPETVVDRVGRALESDLGASDVRRARSEVISWDSAHAYALQDFGVAPDFAREVLHCPTI